MLFMLPGILSLVLVALLWRGDFLRYPLLVAGWCFLAIGLQVISEFGSPGWLAGLLMNVGAAIYLSICLKLG